MGLVLTHWWTGESKDSLIKICSSYGYINFFFVRRKNCFQWEQEKSYLFYWQNFCKTHTWGILSAFIITKKLSIGFVSKNVLSSCFLTILKIWTQVIRLGFKKFSMEIVFLWPSWMKAFLCMCPVQKKPCLRDLPTLCFPALGLPLIGSTLAAICQIKSVFWTIQPLYGP